MARRGEAGLRRVRQRQVESLIEAATAHLPKLLHERLDDLGIDFAILYPSRTLTTTALQRRGAPAGRVPRPERFSAEAYASYGDRMTPVAQIPTHTPEEAIAELEFAVASSASGPILINGVVHRPIGGPAGQGDARVPNWGSGSGERLDTLGLDSEYDYDPFWRRCVELGVAPASHTPGMGWGSRRSLSSYMYNHIGSFGASMDAYCKSLFLGGVTRRFPTLSFGLLEGGVAWACALLADLVGHWEKRNVAAIQHLNPERIDVDLVLQLFEKYGEGRFSRGPARAARVADPARARAARPRRVARARRREQGRAGRAVRAAVLLRMRGGRPDRGLGIRRRVSPAAARCARCSAPTSATGTCRT